MIFNYGSRNGVATIIRITRKICKIYLAFSMPIISYINGSTLTTEQKATVTAWLNGAQEACMILEEIQVRYEN